MYLLLSGEGSGDIGSCTLGCESCEGDQFKPGPMSIIVDQCVDIAQGYEFSHLGNSCLGFVSEKYLAKNKPKTVKKAMSLRGKKKPVETKYFYNNARALAIAAKEKAGQVNDTVVAVLFRDSDGTASAGRGLWQHKRDSMIAGFKQENYGELGVPMIPKPKSEAWLLCAVQDTPYQNCGRFESESGNDKSENPLKDQLSQALASHKSHAGLKDRLLDKSIDVEQIDMDSLNAFKSALNSSVAAAMTKKPQ